MMEQKKNRPVWRDLQSHSSGTYPALLQCLEGGSSTSRRSHADPAIL